MKNLDNDEYASIVSRVATTTSNNKLLTLLMHFSDRSEPRSVEELADALDLPHSTTYRYVKALADVGLVVAASAGYYILGPSIIMLDRQMRLSDPLLTSAQKVKSGLVGELPGPGTILICRLFRRSVMCVDSAEIGDLGFEVSYARGRSLPLHRGAASKVILAHIPLRHVRAYFEVETSKFIDAGLGKDWKAVKGSLRKMRKDGIVITHGELDPGAVGIASPILDGDGQILGSLGYVTRQVNAAPIDFDSISPLIREGADQIRQNLAAFKTRGGLQRE